MKPKLSDGQEIATGGRKGKGKEISVSSSPHGNHESGLPLTQPSKMKANGVTLL